MSLAKTQARESAVLLLFEADSKDKDISSVIDDLEVKPDPYVISILLAFQEKRKDIDELISAHTKGWKKDRLPVFDRAVLRMAVTELVRSAEIPVGTIISESVILCENYSTPESPRFVNGVLGTIAHKVRAVDLVKSVKEKKSEQQND